MKLDKKVLKRSTAISNARKKTINPKMEIFHVICDIDDNFYSSYYSTHIPPNLERSKSLDSRWVKFYVFHRLSQENIKLNELPSIFNIKWEKSSDYGQYYRYLTWPRMLSYLVGYFPIPIDIVEGNEKQKEDYIHNIEQILDDICSIISLNYITAVSWIPTDQGGIPQEYIHHIEIIPEDFAHVLKNTEQLNKLNIENPILYKIIQVGLVKLKESLLSSDHTVRFLLAVSAIENSCLLYYKNFGKNDGKTKQQRNAIKLEDFDRAYQDFLTQKNALKPSKAVNSLQDIYFESIVSIKKSVIHVLDMINANVVKSWLFEGNINAYQIRSDLVHGSWVEWGEDKRQWLFKESLSSPYKVKLFLSTLISYSSQLT